MRTAEGLSLRATFLHASLDIRAGAGIAAGVGEHDAPHGVVRLAIATPVEAVAGDLARGGRDGGDAAQVGCLTLLLPSDNMAALDEILEWSKLRPPWQQDALRRLVTIGVGDGDTIKRYADSCLGQTTDDLEPLDSQHIRSSNGEQLPVAVMGIRGAENVNSLATDEHLTFAPHGLTIVYGDNASGKPGYARVLKAVTRTRASERVW